MLVSLSACVCLSKWRIILLVLNGCSYVHIWNSHSIWSVKLMLYSNVFSYWALVLYKVAFKSVLERSCMPLLAFLLSLWVCMHVHLYVHVCIFLFPLTTFYVSLRLFFLLFLSPHLCFSLTFFLSLFSVLISNILVPFLIGCPVSTLGRENRISYFDFCIKSIIPTF